MPASSPSSRSPARKKTKRSKTTAAAASAPGNGKSGSRAGGTRRPLERIVRIHEAINRGRYPNCSGIAAELETSRKTIQRDVNFMRDQLELPIAYDELEHGYYYTEPVANFPFLQTTAEDLVALIVARNALQHLADTPLVASLRHSFKKLQQGMQDRVSIPWSDLDQAFSVKASGLTQRDLGLFEKISRAILECRELRFDYTKLDARKAEPRHLRPYHLAEIDGGWYVIGHDVDRGARRTFAVQRMKGLSLLRTTFPQAENFCLEDHFAGSFGVWTTPDLGDGKATPTQSVRVRFRGFAARFVPERRWHPSQEIIVLDKSGEEIELRMELAALEDLQRWILSFGSQAEVLAPPQLRASVLRELEAAAKPYR